MSDFISVSYSRYDLFRKCKKAFKYRCLDKLKTAQSPAMARGDDIHKTLEKVVIAQGENKKPPRLKTPTWDITRVVPFLESIRDQNPKAEGGLNFTMKWEPCAWNDWDRCWLRVKVDLSYYPTETSNVTVDYKSGRVKPEEHMEQLSLYAMTRMLVEPKLKKITAGPFYVDHEDKPRLLAVYDGGAARHLDQLKKEWTRKFAPIQREKKFAATPSREACKWCDFAASKGGPCTEEARG